jgi:hypothetical protein
VQVFFVCGAPKSGTTWLQRVLDAHPEVCCSGEGHFIERFSAPLARVVSAYNSDLGLEADQVYEGAPYYQPVDQAEFDDLVRSFILSRLTARAGPGVRWVGDKTPGYAFQLDQLHRIFPEAKFIHIVRDPRDVTVSRMGHSRRVGLTEVFTPGSRQHREVVEAAIRIWIEAVTAVSEFADRHPGRVHELRYRDLYDDPMGETGRLFRFLGAPTEPAILGRIVAATSFEALAGRRPGEEDPGSFFRKGMPDDWKQRLDTETARVIADSCGALMREKRFVA